MLSTVETMSSIGASPSTLMTSPSSVPGVSSVASLTFEHRGVHEVSGAFGDTRGKNGSCNVEKHETQIAGASEEIAIQTLQGRTRHHDWLIISRRSELRHSRIG